MNLGQSAVSARTVDCIDFPGGWIDGVQFERALNGGMNPLRSAEMTVHLRFATGAKLMVDAGARLLSIANQLNHLQKRVTLEFPAEDPSTFDYLNRAGFFDHLSSGIRVLPHRPLVSTAMIYRGGNRGLVEFASLKPNDVERALPDRLAKALAGAIGDAGRRAQIEDAAYTLFGELIGNVYAHSATPIDGFAVLQVYPKGKAAKIAVSDSGHGLLETLRPALKQHYPHLMARSDTELLVQVLRDGLSRNGKGHGCGLKVCADHAVKFGANLEVRLPVSRFRLVAKRGTWQFGRAVVYDACPLIWGTHITFDFQLD